MRAIWLILCACGEVTSTSTWDANGGANPDASSDGSPADDAATSLGPWSTPVRIDMPSVDGFTDSHPSVSADGRELYFTSNRDGGSTDIYVSTRFTTTDPWGPATKVLDLDTTSSTEGGPDLSDDGRTILFSRALVGGSTGNDIFMATRTSPSSPWTNVAPIAELNTTGSERSPHLSSDGKTVWWAKNVGTSTTPDYDIWTATRGTVNGVWSNLKEVARFTSTGQDDSPCATSDELTMYFDSDRASAGESTIYVSTRPLGGGAWSVPHDVPEVAGGLRPDVTPDGRYMVLAKLSADGTTDLYESHR